MQDFSTISVCLSADEKYIWHLFETIWSIRKVSTKRMVDLYVLLDCASKSSYEALAREAFYMSTKTLNVIPVNVNEVIHLDRDNISVTDYISYASYVRIFLPEIFPGLDKMLWLDCDLVVRKPLDEFWDVDVDGKYVAAVDDFTMERSIPIELKECCVTRYFNAGVSLFNLKMIRETGVNETCKKMMYSKKPRFQDQTVLNTCYRENVLWLSPKFNLHYTSFSNKDFSEWSDKSFGERYSSHDDPNVVIAHYTGIGSKPWEKDCDFYYDEYVRNSSELKKFIDSSATSMFAKTKADMARYTPLVPFVRIPPKKHSPKKLDRRVFVCFTSYPARINGIHTVVKKMLSQTVVPTHIIVTLAKEEFPNGEADLPRQFRDTLVNERVVLNWTDENTRTMKKLFPALGIIDQPDDLIIIIDDDITYTSNFVEQRIDDFYKYGERFGISSNDTIETSVGTAVSGAGSLVERRMLDGYARFLTRRVIETYEDDWVYAFVMRMNGRFFVNCSAYDKSKYSYKKMNPSRCYNTRHTIEVLSNRFVEMKKGRG